jgi:hypothetical protein
MTNETQNTEGKTMNKMHEHGCKCGRCETVAARMARDAAFKRRYQIESLAFACGEKHRDHAERVHEGFCYKCQVWL